MKVTGLLLAGGQSKRLGRDKRLLELDGKPLIASSYKKLQAACNEVIVLVADHADEELLDTHLPPSVSYVHDEDPDEGPMGALSTGLNNINTPWALLLAVDLPRMTGHFLGKMCAYAGDLEDGVDVVVPKYRGHLQVASALYHRDALGKLTSAFEGGERSLHSWARLDSTRTHVIEPEVWANWGNEEVFFNLNEIEDLDELSGGH